MIEKCAKNETNEAKKYLGLKQLIELDGKEKINEVWKMQVEWIKQKKKINEGIHNLITWEKNKWKTVVWKLENYENMRDDKRKSSKIYDRKKETTESVKIRIIECYE